MLLHLGAPLVSSGNPLSMLVSNVGHLPSLGSPYFATDQHRRRRLFRTSTIVPRLHPVGKGPEGVPSSLFKFRPKVRHSRTTVDGDADAEGAVQGLQAGVIEESDLGDVSDLLVEVFQPGVILADGEFSDLESVVIGAPLEMTNKYLRAVAYNEILYSLKSRCGKRLARGDFAHTNEALVLAVRDRAKDCGDAGEIIAVVELTLRKPDGSLPTNWPFPAPWRPAEPAKVWEPYMGNLAVAERHRGKGYGKQLVRLCEHVAKNHWGYERMFLHVDMDDPAATGLYSSMGYKSMEQYDAPLWMRRLFSMPTIRYQVKQFNGRRNLA